MRREFILNIIFLVVINILVKPGYTFLIETQVQNIIGPEEFGLYFSLFNLSYILQILLDLGIHNYGSQYLAKEEGDSQVYLSTAFTAKAWLLLLFALAILLCALVLDYNSRMRHMLVLVSINQVCISAIFFYRSSLAALSHYRMNSFISVLDKLFMISIFYYALFVNDDWLAVFDIYDFIYIRMASYILTTLVSAFLLYWIGKQVIFWSTDISKIKDLLKKSLPFAIIVIFMGICYRTDAVMLERMLRDDGLEAGIYAAAYRIYHAMNTLGFLFSMLLLPMFANLLKSDRQELKRLTLLSLETILFLTCSTVAIVYIMREQIMEWLYQVDVLIYGTQILVLLSMTLILSSVIYVFGTLITANARLRELNILFVIATFFNISVNWYLIPKTGAVGAAWATLLTELLVVIGQAFIVYFIIPLRISFLQLARILIFIISVFTITILIQNLNYDLLIKSVLLMSMVLLIALTTKVLRPRKLLGILKTTSPSTE